MSVRKVGVEEEFLLVDPSTGQATAVAGAVMRVAADRDGPYPSQPGDAEPLEFELQEQQVEISTRPCSSLDDLRREVLRARTGAAEAAARAGAGLAALATSPVPVQPSITGKPRYRRMAREFGLTAQEQLTCGCHVHVDISSPAEGVAILDRMQRWLAPVLALSANSPYWQGSDSGYASFRYQVWGRWPCSGPTAWFGSATDYAATIEAMTSTGTVLDDGMVYFNARLSARYPTLEVRIADVCLIPDDAVLVAALLRALAATEAAAWRDEDPATPVRPEILQLAAWRASNSGVSGNLVHPVTGQAAPAVVVLAALVEHVTPALAEAGDTGAVADLLAAVLARGTGAAIQRDAYARREELRDVVTAALARTVPA